MSARIGGQAQGTHGLDRRQKGRGAKEDQSHRENGHELDDDAQQLQAALQPQRQGPIWMSTVDPDKKGSRTATIRRKAPG